MTKRVKRILLYPSVHCGQTPRRSARGHLQMTQCRIGAVEPSALSLRVYGWVCRIVEVLAGEGPHLLATEASRIGLLTVPAGRRPEERATRPVRGEEFAVGCVEPPLGADI